MFEMSNYGALLFIEYPSEHGYEILCPLLVST